MKLYFKPVTSENRKQVEELSLFPEQIDFIESVADCLKEAATTTLWEPICIYVDTLLVGFAMYGYFKEFASNGEAWLDRILIDKKSQGKGYGKLAILALLKKMEQEFCCDEIYLSVYDVNKQAIALYERIGFYFSGEYDTKGEKIMVYDVKHI